MNLLSELASSSSAMLFGPPAPVAKDPPPPLKRTSMSASRKAALLRPNLGLAHAPATHEAHDEAPLPAIPETETTAASVLVSTGASALTFLGSTVVSLTSAAASALVSPHPAAKIDADKAAPKEGEGEGMLSTLSSAVVSSAASVRDLVFGTSADTAPAKDAPVSDAAPRVKRASTLPVQLTATGEPFSDDPSISAMQRIPDHPCGQVAHHKLTHCCSAPAIPTAACTCTCSTAKEPQCECGCHTTTATRRDSGHFHRVEQLVKGTKRVVRDIKNVL